MPHGAGGYRKRLCHSIMGGKKMFKCVVCDELLEPHRCRYSADESRCELYVICPRCGGECENYEEEGEGWSEDGEEGASEADE